MRKKISILGAGGFGREVKQLIEDINLVEESWELEGFYDPNFQKGTLVNGLPVLGGNKEALQSDNIYFVMAICKPLILEKLSKNFLDNGKTFPNIIHPSASMGCPKSNQIGIGNILTFGFHMTTNIKLGDFNIFNTRASIGHDVNIGSYNVFMPNVQLSGEISIGDKNFFGMNSSVLRGKRINSHNTIGAHSLVVSDIAKNQNVFGIPAVRI